MSEQDNGERGDVAGEQLVDEAELESVTGGLTRAYGPALTSLQRGTLILRPVLDISKIFQDMDAHRS
jgi:hypothetical protein